MGRQVRRVPANWEHPKDEKGRYIPLFGRCFTKTLAEWEEGNRQWDLGFVRDWLKDGDWRPKPKDTKSETFEEWDGRKPVASDYMPEWPDAERTHIQMYETCTEGTPLSPVMDTPENLARWLADNGASAFGSTTATYEQWLSACQRGWAPSGVGIIGRGIVSGVEGLHGR